MSDGKEIPYQLRPNKFIDRQIFLDLLLRVVPLKQVGRYAYVSMGGKHLVDHEAIYRRVGIKSLYCFDGDKDIVDRQQCNKPIASAVCVEMMSGSLAGEIDAILAQFEAAQNLILWLDYTRPAERLSQLQELTACLSKAQSGDVIRITMNADDFTLRGPWEKEFDAPGKYRAHRLRIQIGDFLSSDVEEIVEGQLPVVLSGAVQLACSIAGEGKRLTFHPILITSYADGQRMLTVTVLALPNGEPLPLGLQDWEFLAKRWSDVVDISAPDLSLREKTLIDRHLSKSPGAIVRAIKFFPANDLDDARKAVASYKRLHRFYPTFLSIGVQ
jgi:hypothetical protein